MPLLVTETGTALFESDAIVEHLDETQDPIDSDITPEQRGLDHAWSYQASKHYLAQCSAIRSTDEKTLLERTDNLGKAFAKVEKKIGDGPYFKWCCD